MNAAAKGKTKTGPGTRKRPDPAPTVFGYHEIFHALVILAAALPYAVVAFWVLPGS